MRKRAGCEIGRHFPRCAEMSIWIFTSSPPYDFVSCIGNTILLPMFAFANNNNNNPRDMRRTAVHMFSSLPVVYASRLAEVTEKLPPQNGNECDRF